MVAMCIIIMAARMLLHVCTLLCQAISVAQNLMSEVSCCFIFAFACFCLGVHHCCYCVHPCINAKLLYKE